MKLQKSLRPEHIRKFNKNYSPEAADTVNAGFHSTLAQQAPQEVAEAMEDSNPVKKTGDKFDGIAPKAVFDLPSGRYMMKLYHQKPQSRTKSMDPNPIHGWSTIATHALFHAAGLGDNVENVSMANHDGKWYTVHKFEPNADYAYKSKNRLDNLPILKTAVMDFLIGNPDRHAFNILHSGHDKMIAIDHERAFQYKKLPARGGTFAIGGGNSFHNLHVYMNTRGLKELGDSNKRYMGDSVATWFMDNHDNIMNTFNKHVDAIQDARIKDHITANFHNRMKYLKDSFTQYLQDREEGNIDEADPNEDMNPLHINYPNTVRFLPIRRKSKKDIFIPPSEKLEKSLGDWEKEGYRLEHGIDKHGYHYVSAYDKDNNPVGIAKFNHVLVPDPTDTHLVPHKDYMKGWDVWVHPDHQRKGIASAMYKLAEQKSGKKIVPSDIQLDDGRKLWKQPNREFGNLTIDDKINLKPNPMRKSEPLEKSIKKEDWDNLLKGHRNDGPNTLDVTPHFKMTQEHVPTELHTEVFNDPQEKTNVSKNIGGISEKAVFDTSGGRVMIKPYYRGASEHGMPTLGWSSVVVPHLYKVAGIGHLCDKVGVTAHNGIPCTVHKFDPDVTELPTTLSTTAHVHDFAKIAVMDFLTNNLDRHKCNVMVKHNADGIDTPLAIDNERSFLYTHTKAGAVGGSDPLRDYYDMSALKAYHKKVPREEVPAIAKWWMTHEYAIKTEFQNHLRNIQDKSLVNHLISNFNDRHRSLTQAFEPWSKGKGILNPFASPNTFSILERRLETREPKPKPVESEGTEPKINPNAPTQVMSDFPDETPIPINRKRLTR